MYAIAALMKQQRCCQPVCSLWHPETLVCWQVGDLMVLYARPRSYVHLITSRLPKRLTQVHQVASTLWLVQDRST